MKYEIQIINEINCIDIQNIAYDKSIHKIFFLKKDKLYQYNFYDAEIIEILSELDIVPDKIFYRDVDDSLLFISDGIYIFNIKSKSINKILEFEYDEYYYFNYLSNIDSIILSKHINIDNDSRIILFDIKTLKLSILINKIRFRVTNAKYIKNKIFFVIVPFPFESEIYSYDLKNGNFELHFKYNDYIFDFIYFEKSNKILFLYTSAEPKPSFLGLYNLHTFKIEHIKNEDNVNILSISDYNNLYFISFNSQSEKQIIFWKKDFSSNITCSSNLKGSVCLFPNKNNFKKFLTYDKIKKCIYLWEII